MANIKVKVFSLGELETNCIVVSDDKNNCVLIDIAYFCEDIEYYVKHNKLNIAAILLTHGHFDHCGGVSSLKRNLKLESVPVYCAPADWEMCQQATQNLWGIPCEDCIPTNQITTNSLDFGDLHFDVHFTPGHTFGSVVFVCQDYMFTGDTLFKGAVGRTDLGGHTGTLLKSIELFKSFNKDYTIIPGHGDSSTLSFELSHNPYLR